MGTHIVIIDPPKNIEKYIADDKVVRPVQHKSSELYEIFCEAFVSNVCRSTIGWEIFALNIVCAKNSRIK